MVEKRWKRSTPCRLRYGLIRYSIVGQEDVSSVRSPIIDRSTAISWSRMAIPREIPHSSCPETRTNCYPTATYSPERSRADVTRWMMLLVSSSITTGHVCVATRRTALRAVLEAEQRQEVKTVVVVTHTVPIREGLVWNTDERWNPQNASFVNSRMQTVITCAQNTKITTWCFGPSHHSGRFHMEWHSVRQ